MSNDREVAVIGGGCFWCTEAVYSQIKGVISVEPGYAGGVTENPTYQEVSTSTTGHAEVIRVEFDPLLISYKKLLDVFWTVHDPTTQNQQGSDVGSQYRSIILFSSEEQHRVALESRSQMEMSCLFSKPIVTEVAPLKKFYPAEDYHRDYFSNHQSQPYCSLIIQPKLQHFSKKFSDLLK